MNRTGTCRAHRGMLLGTILVGILFTFNINALADMGHSFTAEDCALCHIDATERSTASKAFPGEEIYPACDICHEVGEPWGVHRESK